MLTNHLTVMKCFSLGKVGWRQVVNTVVSLPVRPAVNTQVCVKFPCYQVNTVRCVGAS